MGGLERKMIDEGIAYYIPLRYSELPRYYQENVEPVHVAMLRWRRWMKMVFHFGLNASHSPRCVTAQKL